MNQNIIHMNSSTNNCLSELVSLTRPLFKQGFQSIYETICEKNEASNSMLFREFQEELQKVPSWNSVMIEKEYDRFIASTRCEWLGELIVANFKASARNVLSSIQSYAQQDNSIDLAVPLPQNFLHYCYIEIARQLWKKPQLFYQNYLPHEKQLNDESIDKIIETSIETTINKNLPFDTLLKQSNQPVTNAEAIVQEQEPEEADELPTMSMTTLTTTAEANDLSVSSSPVVSLNKSASFVAPRRDSLDDEDDESDASYDDSYEETISNVSEDSTVKPEDAMQSNTSEKDDVDVITNDLTHKVDILGHIDQPHASPHNATHLESRPTTNVTASASKLEDNNENHSNVQENIMVAKPKDDEIFHIDLNKTIKEIYINDKKRKNEKKIKKILGVKMNYDTYIQQDKRKLRNYLILNQHIAKP